MLYCNNCADKKGWPKSQIAPFGTCEICRAMTAFCNDTPFYMLNKKGLKECDAEIMSKCKWGIRSPHFGSFCLSDYPKCFDKARPDRKVFCGDCRYCDASFLMGISYDHVCNHPKNSADSFYEPDALNISTPQERNKNNDCGDYEERP